MHRELVYLKGLAKGAGFMQTLKAINVASQLHQGQKRKLGEDYIEHPMRVAKELISLKLYDDKLLAAALLHDVLEDCNLSEFDLNEKYGIDKDIVEIVKILTKNSCQAPKDSAVDTTGVYYSKILNNHYATLVKISDRCHNVSTMVEAFTKNKIKSYIKETEDYVIPLCKLAVVKYPEYSDEIFAMRYHIESVCYALTVCIDALESKEV